MIQLKSIYEFEKSQKYLTKKLVKLIFKSLYKKYFLQKIVKKKLNN